MKVEKGTKEVTTIELPDYLKEQLEDSRKQIEALPAAYQAALEKEQVAISSRFEGAVQGFMLSKGYPKDVKFKLEDGVITLEEKA